jgi:hypothetical protein
MSHDKRKENARSQGWDFGTFDAFRAFAGANPPAVQFELCAVGTAEERALHTRATTGPYVLGGERIARPARDYACHFGAHQEVEAALGLMSPTDRPEATEVVLAALTACINAAVGTSALHRGLRLTHLETRARIGWNPAVYLHLAEAEEGSFPADQFGELHVELHVRGENLDEDDIAFLQASVNRSAVYNLLRRDHVCLPAVMTAEPASQEPVHQHRRPQL